MAIYQKIKPIKPPLRNLPDNIDFHSVTYWTIKMFSILFYYLELNVSYSIYLLL